jgi:hypothetical protein
MSLKLVEVVAKPFYTIYEEKPARIETPTLPVMECREATDLMTMLRDMVPLIVYGAPQTGKTRLLQALAAAEQLMMLTYDSNLSLPYVVPGLALRPLALMYVPEIIALLRPGTAMGNIAVVGAVKRYLRRHYLGYEEPLPEFQDDATERVYRHMLQSTLNVVSQFSRYVLYRPFGAVKMYMDEPLIVATLAISAAAAAGEVEPVPVPLGPGGGGRPVLVLDDATTLARYNLNILQVGRHLGVRAVALHPDPSVPLHVVEQYPRCYAPGADPRDKSSRDYNCYRGVGNWGRFKIRRKEVEKVIECARKTYASIASYGFI